MKKIEEMTIGEARELLPQCREILSMFGGTLPNEDTAGDFPLLDKPVLVRTVTHYYTGRLVAVQAGCMILEEAAWIGDTGRFADALATGGLAEVEPYPGRCVVAFGAVVDFSEWTHPLPRTQK